MKIIRTIAMLAGLLVATTVGAMDLDKLQNEVLGSTAQLNNSCTAQLIYSDRDKETGKVETLLLTAKHCVESTPNVEQRVEFPVYQNMRVVKKEQYLGTVAGMYYKGDLALVKLKDQNTFFPNVVNIADKATQIRMGEDVVTVGYPLGRGLTVTEGLFGALEVDPGFGESMGKEFFRATPDIAGGSSGGGMYRMTDKGDFELIGTVTGGYPKASFINFYTPVEVINEYLEVAVPKLYIKRNNQ